jgi:hypothetical protein
VRPLPRYVLAIMAAFVAFELWIPLLAIIIRALVGSTVPTAVQAVVPLFGLAVPVAVGLALSDYLADRQGLVRPYQPKRRSGNGVPDRDSDALDDEADEEPEEPEDLGEGEEPEEPEALGEGEEREKPEALGQGEPEALGQGEQEERLDGRDGREMHEHRQPDRGGGASGRPHGRVP